MRDWICVTLGAFKDFCQAAKPFVSVASQFFSAFYTRDNLDLLQSFADIISNIKQEYSGDYGLANAM